MLPRFTRELQSSKDDLDYHMVWRYTKANKLPRVLVWLASRPRLAQALADDAVELSQAKDAAGEGSPS